MRELPQTYRDVIDKYLPEISVDFVEGLDHWGEYDPTTNTIELTTRWVTATNNYNVKLYVILHEIAHAMTWTQAPGHSKSFWEVLYLLVINHKIPGSVARIVEEVYPAEWDSIPG